MLTYPHANAGLMHIKKLRLLNFRSHCDLQIDDISRFVQIIGPNGSGKTNILESISLLSPGKGMHNRQFEEMLSTHQDIYKEWSVSAELIDEKHIVTGAKVASGSAKRVSYIDNEKVSKQAELIDALRVIWLTPQMDDLFIAPAALRRKFIDRMTYTFHPAHATDMAKYEYFMRSRLKLLLDGCSNQLWLQQMEAKMADYAFVVFQQRLRVIELIQRMLKLNEGLFLTPEIALEIGCDDVSLENINRTLRNNRNLDAKKARTHFGPHKTELMTRHPAKQRSAFQCSTGEQKSMLLSLIIAQAKGITQCCKSAPILLLDEIFTHLDQGVEKNLIATLQNFSAQIWITATEHNNEMESETIVRL